MLTTRDAAARLGLTPQSVARLCKQGQIRAERIGRDYLISEDELERFAALDRPSHRPRRITMDAKLTKIAIVDDRQRERYQIVYMYSDGTQSDPKGSYATYEQAYEEVQDHANPAAAELYEQVPIEDWTK